ncbi:hypothetical protein C0991_011400 [Blastosporella zonata]|nr:hypothetical protein C0991_011400 [Blastosporella zonata]
MSSGDVKIHSVPKLSPGNVKPQLNKISAQLTQNKMRGGAQAMCQYPYPRLNHTDFE